MQGEKNDASNQTDPAFTISEVLLVPLLTLSNNKFLPFPEFSHVFPLKHPAQCPPTYCIFEANSP